MNAQPDYFANHEKARKFPWTLYHAPLERDLGNFLHRVAGEHPEGDVLVVGCGLLHEIDAAPPGLRYTVVDIDPRAVEAVLARKDPRIAGGHVVAPEQPIAEVASLMSNKDVDRVPVVREGQLVGFLTRGDIVRKLIGN